MRTDGEPRRGSGQQNLAAAAGRGGGFTGAVPSRAAGASISGHSIAKAALASLLAHGCVLLVFILLDPARNPPARPREIPVELAMEPAASQERPAARIETSDKQDARNGSPEARTKKIARGGARQTGHAEHRPAPPFDSGPQSFRAVAVPLPAGSGGEAMSYRFIVGGMLERVKKYPKPAIQRGAKGVAIVGFVLDGSGRVESVSLLRPSGEADLDAEGMNLVHRAAPFPPPPPGAQRSFAIEVAFGMGQ